MNPLLIVTFTASRLVKGVHVFVRCISDLVSSSTNASFSVGNTSTDNESVVDVKAFSLFVP